VKKTQGRSQLDIKITKWLSRCEGPHPMILEKKRSSIKKNWKYIRFSGFWKFSINRLAGCS